MAFSKVYTGGRSLRSRGGRLSNQQIHFIIWTNTFYNLDKYIFLMAFTRVDVLLDQGEVAWVTNWQMEMQCWRPPLFNMIL